ncbi:hypothetical protein FOQG_17492 [Fusarium oxysporum f. sp. raphani 54005]|uniref:Uncharacterized protein n=1 Tax=Fusarium oxysporum f. sp. raphani 54005 TaxID=1089458 RepID=X0B7R5_FUSOX|nr:hypothetical protein FOQG_17492 [Fusarium oxysporum f. sp. raphani 54005]
MARPDIAIPETELRRGPPEAENPAMENRWVWWLRMHSDWAKQSLYKRLAGTAAVQFK